MWQARAAPWLLVMAGTAWLGISAYLFAQHWYGERVSSQLNGPPFSWGDQHPECRNRFGFWPDGSPMEASELSVFKDVDIAFERSLGITRTRTPEQIARDNWARDVRKKIASCEEAQWLPTAKATAIRTDRIELLAFVLLPPFLFLMGVGLIALKTGRITTVAGKLIATFGALSATIAVLEVINEVGEKYSPFVTGHNETISFSGPGPALEVACALAIPLSITLWWRAPISASERIIACCAGIAAAAMPIVLHFLSRPFGLGPYSNRGLAATVVAVFAVVSLSIVVTKHFLQFSSSAASPASLFPVISREAS